jgi:hypothetical protein
MVLYPATQRRAQEELDASAERGHLPTFEDAENFPYITAVVQEVLRWNPVGTVGECHLTVSRLDSSPMLMSGLPILIILTGYYVYAHI